MSVERVILQGKLAGFGSIGSTWGLWLVKLGMYSRLEAKDSIQIHCSWSEQPGL